MEPSTGNLERCPDPTKSSALATLLDAVEHHVRRYVVLVADQAGAIALWIAHTHAFAAAHATPYVSITSPEMQSGKTRLLETAEPLVAGPWFTGRTSPAALVRKVDAERPTLLLDESDAAFNGDREYAETLRGVLNSGHRRGGAVTVCVGQGPKIVARDFSTFCPKAIAGIGKLPDTVADRSIPIRLKRRAPSEAVERLRERKVRPTAEALAATLVEWADEPTIEALAEAEPELPETISDRAADCWEPLIAIADLAGDRWPERARSIAERLSAALDPDEATIGVRLLADCRKAFGREDRLPTRDLLEYLHALEEAPWADWYGKAISARKVADLLRRYEIKVKKMRFDERTLRGYERVQFEDAWSRYLPPTPASIRNIRSNGSNKPKTDVSKAEHGGSTFRIENPGKPLEQANVPDVPDSDGGYREKRPDKLPEARPATDEEERRIADLLGVRLYDDEDPRP